MSIWKNTCFTRFFTSFTINSFGDWFDIFALQIIFVYQWGATPIMQSVLLLAFFLPSIILSPYAGVIADRLNLRNIMVYTDILATFLTAALVLTHSIMVALTLIIIRSCIVSFTGPAQQAYIKHIVVDEHLLKASSYTTIVGQIGKITGPMLGAVILTIATPRTCLAINAASYAFSALILIGLPKGERTKDLVQDTQKGFKRLGEGIQYIWHRPMIRFTLMLVTVWFFVSLSRQVQLAIFLNHLFPQQQNALGWFMGFDGLGVVLISTLLTRQTTIKNYALSFFSGFILLGLGILGVAIYQSNWPHYWLYLTAVVTGMGTGVLLINYGYIIKKQTPKEHMGRVSGTASSLQNLAAMLGTLTSGFLVMALGVRTFYVTLAVIMAVLAVIALIGFSKQPTSQA